MVPVVLDPSAFFANATTISAWLNRPLTLPSLRDGSLPLPRKSAGEGSHWLRFVILMRITPPPPRPNQTLLAYRWRCG